MHDTAYEIGSLFLQSYAAQDRNIIVEIGSQAYNGTLRDVAPANSTYIGLDVDHGPSVDLIIDPEKPYPLRNDFADLVLSSSQMEHDSFFWMTFLELCRILKPGGHLYINVPSNGQFHRFPQDCWRFYPDAGQTLSRWAKRNGIDINLVESFIARRHADIWNDFVAVFRKGPMDSPPPILLSDRVPCMNVLTWCSQDYERLNGLLEDGEMIAALRAENQTLRVRLESIEHDLELLKDQNSLPLPMD